ncbi:MAG: hypothetical protein ACKVS9_11370 [Phycisphaerae bacterium]
MLILGTVFQLLITRAFAQCIEQRQRVFSNLGGAQPDRFGQCVAVDRGLLIAGAPGRTDSGENSGGAVAYRYAGGQWVFETELLPATASAGDVFGRVVDVSGRVAVVGGQLDDPFGELPRVGSVAVFRKRVIDETWTQDTTLNAGDATAGDEFGASVAIDGDIIVVGAPGKDGTGTLGGAAYVFEYDGVQWQETGAFVPGTIQPFRFYGDDVAVEGDLIAIGAPGDNEAAEGSGSVEIYRREFGDWNFQQRIFDFDAFEGSGFGKRLTIDNGRIFVTLPGHLNNVNAIGSVQIFENDPLDGWTATAELVPTGSLVGEQFAVDVAVGGPNALVTASYTDPNDPNAGEQRLAYVFTLDDGQWTQTARITPDGFLAGDIYGFFADMDHTTAVVGSFLRNASGSVYVYDLGACGDCVGDVNGDAQVNLTDLAVLLANFGLTDGAVRTLGDLDDDGDTELTDLAILLSEFGTICE